MAFLRVRQEFDLPGAVSGDGVFLRMPQADDFAAWAELRSSSRAFLEPWEPAWPADDLTRPAWRRRLRRYTREAREDRAYPFFLFDDTTRALVGGITVANVRRGVAQAGSLGYWMGKRFAGQGYMTRGIAAVLPFLFHGLRLHRIEAACLPHNHASLRILEKNGFTREGYARKYLCINGTWQDHLTFALLAGEERPNAGKIR